MNIMVFSKVLVALIMHSCVTAILIPTPKADDLAPLYEAAVDIVITCYGDSHKTIGIAGDSDGSFLRELRSKYSNAVVLIDPATRSYSTTYPSGSRLYKLDVFIIATDSRKKFSRLVEGLWESVWWNTNADFLILDSTPDTNGQCSLRFKYMYVTSKLMGILNTQFICFERAEQILLHTVNPFTSYAPQSWSFLAALQPKNNMPFYVFMRTYEKGARNCEDLNFSKTRDLGRFPLHFLSEEVANRDLFADKKELTRNQSIVRKVGASIVRDEFIWFIKNINIALNSTSMISANKHTNLFTISLLPAIFGSGDYSQMRHPDRSIFSQNQVQFFAVTQHTMHKSQLEKILTVIDKNSRIGMCLVYLVTFIFFKFFLDQAIVPALLNLMRLTCNTGLTTLPQKLAPTIYLACLFAFVVTLQGIYTGNLASLLTTTVAYPNVNTIKDIAVLGYTPYSYQHLYNKLAANPDFGKRAISVPLSGKREEKCMRYVLADRLAACIAETHYALSSADYWNLHISRDPILNEYTFHDISESNPLGRRLEALLLLWEESSLRRTNITVRSLLDRFVDDDEVKMNTERRVMTLVDLWFAFEILLVGLACSSICFISELVIWRVRLKMAKRRDRARARLAWGPTKKSCFSSLNLRFNLRRLFSKRR